jgi:alkyl hydroperoxide reductase subunit D
MAMNNVYYRFTHLVGDSEYQTLRAGLRMNAMSNPGCDKIDFELCSLAVSAINGCGMCMDSHEKTLRKHGVTAQAIQSAVRIAAVVNAVAVTLEQNAATSDSVTDLAA